MKPRYCLNKGNCLINVDPSINAVGCCTNTDSCPTFHTACVPLTVSCGAVCQKSPLNLVWLVLFNPFFHFILVSGQFISYHTNLRLEQKSGNDLPICATYTYPGSYTEVRCESTSPTELQVAFTFHGFQTPLQLPGLITAFTNCASGSCKPLLDLVTQTPTAIVIATAPATQTAISTGISISTDLFSDSNATSRLSAGTIAGAIIGTLLFLITTGAGVFFFLRSKEKYKIIPDKAFTEGMGTMKPLPTVPKSYRKSRVPIVTSGELVELPGSRWSMQMMGDQRFEPVELP